MRMPLSTLRELLDYHYDRRERVYEFLSSVRAEDFVRPMNTGWSNIRNTLVHSLETEDYWIQHVLHGRERPNHLFDAYPDVESVSWLAQQVRQRTEAYVADLSEVDLSRPGSKTYSSGTVVKYTTGKVLLHVITHDTHHRGQILAMARQMEYTPPEIDLI